MYSTTVEYDGGNPPGHVGQTRDKVVRHRESTSGGFTNKELLHERWLGGAIFHTDYSYTGLKVDRFIQDVEIPNFTSLKKCGEFLPLNPCEISTRKEQRTAGTFNMNNGSFEVIGQYYYLSPWDIAPPVPDFSLAQNAANAAAARAASSQFDYLTFLAELQDSINTVRSIATRFNHLTRNLASEAARYRRNPWKRFQELWLGARYGVRPLVYDAINMRNALVNKERKILKGQDRSTQSLNNSATRTYAVNARYTLTKTEVIQGTRDYRGVAYCSTDFLVGSNFGADPLVTAWELVPYSFVVDWFIDIGGWVQTLRPRLTGGYRGIAFSIKDEYTRTQTYTLEGIRSAGWTGTASGNKTVESVRSYSRAPTLVSFPSVSPDINLAQAVDLATLFLKGKNNVFSILNRR